ncbi:MAG: FixH family protein [Thermodesulfovibrionales bacterium]|jgi:hypothetical protein
MKRQIRQTRVQCAVAVVILLAATILLFVSGCSKSITKTTEKGVFQIRIIGKGKIIRYGRNEVMLKITDEKGQGVEGAHIEITPWMPEHGHGAPWPPIVTEQGRGAYKAVFPIIMLGNWELKIKIKKDNRDDTALFIFPDVKK